MRWDMGLALEDSSAAVAAVVAVVAVALGLLSSKSAFFEDFGPPEGMLEPWLGLFSSKSVFF